MTAVDSAAPTARTAGAGSWLRWTVSAVFGLLYAYAIWAAVAALALAASGEPGLNGKGWIVLLLPVIFPILVFVGGFIFGRRRRVWQLALIFTAGLTLVAIFWLDIIMFQISSGASLLAS